MSRDFNLVAPVKATGPRTVRPDVIEDVDDMWKAISENPGYHITLAFENDKDAAGWLNNAKAYAQGQGLRLRKVRDDSLPDSFVRVHIETQEEYVKRSAEAKQRKAELEAQKAAGVEVKRGRKPAVKK